MGNCSTASNTAFDRITALNITSSIAAGNNNGPVTQPGNCSKVITVAVTGYPDVIVIYDSANKRFKLVGLPGDTALTITITAAQGSVFVVSNSVTIPAK